VASTYRLIVDGQPADADLYTLLATLEVEENADLPGAIQFTLPVSRSDAGDLTPVSDARFKPFANLAVVATPEGKSDECLFDGYVLSHKLHLETGTTNSTLEVFGQDASWVMNLEEKVREWVDVTDGDVANAIFGDYGMDPAPENTSDDSPSHTEAGHSLMQRGSDIQFLRGLARRNGKLCRVTCKDTPGQRTGYFARPKLDGDPVVTLTLNDPESWTVNKLDFEWDATHPTAVSARQALFNDNSEDGAGVDVDDSGLKLLADRKLSDFTGKTMRSLLTVPVDAAGELTMRAQSLLREAGWFARCTGEADVARLNAILRVGTVVQIGGVGSLHTGKYLVWSVRHTFTAESHKMRFMLVRNAVGPEPGGGGGGLLGGLL
jgi:phage protein D